MTITEQLAAIQQILKKRLSVIYQQDFCLRLAAVIITDKKGFENQLMQIDLLSALVETSIMLSNPRRALQYVCILDNAIEQLAVRVNTAYSLKLEKLL